MGLSGPFFFLWGDEVFRFVFDFLMSFGLGCCMGIMWIILCVGCFCFFCGLWSNSKVTMQFLCLSDVAWRSFAFALPFRYLVSAMLTTQIFALRCVFEGDSFFFLNLDQYLKNQCFSFRLCVGSFHWAMMRVRSVFQSRKPPSNEVLSYYVKHSKTSESSLFGSVILRDVHVCLLVVVFFSSWQTHVLYIKALKLQSSLVW